MLLVSGFKLILKLLISNATMRLLCLITNKVLKVTTKYCDIIVLTWQQVNFVLKRSNLLLTLFNDI